MVINQERVDELRQVEVFSALNDDQLRWFLERCQERTLEAGELALQQGADAEYLVVVLEGELQGSTTEGGENYVFTMHAKTVGGMLPFSRMRKVPANVRATVKTRALLFHRDQFPQLYVNLPDLIPKLVAILADRVRETAKVISQHEKLASLGKLSAGLAHELNNPASAARQASLTARRAFEQFVNASDGFLVLRPTEAFLKEVCAMEEAAAVGIPNRSSGAIPIAAVVLRAPVAADELLEHCRDRLRQGHAPARVVVLDALPKTAGAKLDRAALKKLLVARVRP